MDVKNDSPVEEPSREVETQSSPSSLRLPEQSGHSSSSETQNRAIHDAHLHEQETSNSAEMGQDLGSDWSGSGRSGTRQKRSLYERPSSSRRPLPVPGPPAASIRRGSARGGEERPPSASELRRRRSSAREAGINLIPRRRPSVDPSGRRATTGDEAAVAAQRRRDNRRRASLFGRTLSDDPVVPAEQLRPDVPGLPTHAPARRPSLSTALSDAESGATATAQRRRDSRRRGSLFSRSVDPPADPSPAPADHHQPQPGAPEPPSPSIPAELLAQLHPDLLNYAPDVPARRRSLVPADDPAANEDAHKKPPPRGRRQSLFTRSASAEDAGADAPGLDLLLVSHDGAEGAAKEGAAGGKKMPFRGRRRSVAPRRELSPQELQALTAKAAEPRPPPVDPEISAAVEWVVGKLEEEEAAADGEEVLWQAMRDVERQTAKVVNAMEAQRVDALFTELDANGSGGLDWMEVRKGAAVLGNIDEFHLQKLFAKLCNSWREVGRVQFTVLVRTVKYSEVHGGTFVLECVEAVNALRARGAPSDGFGRRLSSGSVVDDLAMQLHTGPEEAADDTVKALAAQKLCYISRHGQTKERARRQTYIANMGALPALLRALKAEDPQCQHWSVQALIQVVERNQGVADSFIDIGGIAMVADLIQEEGRLVRKAQAGALLLIDAACAASRHGRRSILRRQHNVRQLGDQRAWRRRVGSVTRVEGQVIDFAVKAIEETVFPAAEPDARAPATREGAGRGSGSWRPAKREPYWPLVASAVELLATLSCEASVRPALLRTGMGKVRSALALVQRKGRETSVTRVRRQGLIAVATSGRTPASCLAASIAVANLMGATWPPWVSHPTRDLVIGIIVDALEKGTFSSSDGYESVWKICMALAVLAGNGENRWLMRKMEVDTKLQQMLELGAEKMHAATQSESCLALWQLSFDDGPFIQLPKAYTAPPQERAPRRLFHLLQPMRWPLKEHLGEVSDFQLVVDDWEELGAERDPVVPGQHSMDILKLLDLRGNTLFEKWLCDLVTRMIASWKTISPAFKAMATTADDGTSLCLEEMQSLFSSLAKYVHFTSKEVAWIFEAATAPTGLERVTLHDLRVLCESNSLEFLEELGPNLVQGRRLQWFRGHVVWERKEEPVQDTAPGEGEGEGGDGDASAPRSEAPEAATVKADTALGEAGVGKADPQLEADQSVAAPGKDDAMEEQTAIGERYEAEFREFVGGAERREVGGEEVYWVEGRDVVLYRCREGWPLRAVNAEPREAMELEVVGWEWSPVRLLRVLRGGDEDDERPYGKGEAVWDAESGRPEFLRRAVSEARVEEPEEAEWVGEDDDESDDEEPLLGKTRQERTRDEAMRMLQVANSEVADLQEAMVAAERTVLRNSFHEVDADGSGRVDAEEMVNALREMGLAATEADVEQMMAAVDVGGQLRDLKAKVLDMRARAATFDLGLKESERLELAWCEEELAALQERLDIDEEGSFGFEGYSAMVHLNDASPRHLPRMAPFPQNLFVGQRLGKYLFRSAHSRPWLEVYQEMPRTVERLREISLQGAREMGLQVSILKPNACEKNAHGALMVCGEQPLVPPMPAMGFAFLSYDASAQEYVQDVKNVLAEIGMRSVDDRVGTHFQAQVRSAGVVIAVMTEGFQHSAQCRTETMLGRQMGKTLILLQVEVFEVRETWLKHLLGIPIEAPTLLHTLPSCATWLRGSRMVTTTLTPPYKDLRPPVPTLLDTFSYFVPSEGTVALVSRPVTLVKGLGWLQPEHAPLGQLSEGVQERGDIDKEVITGPVVIDFRRSPSMPELQANLRGAQAEFAVLEEDAAAAEAEEQRARGELEAAEAELGEAEAAEASWSREHAEAAAALPRAGDALAMAEVTLQRAEEDLRVARDVLAASRELEAAVSEVARAQEQVAASGDRSRTAAQELQKAQQGAQRKRAGRAEAGERAASARARRAASQLLLQRAAEQLQRRQRLHQEEVERAAVRPQTEEAVEALKQEIGQYQRLYRMGLFFGNATFFKCWVRICLYAGARVQLKRKMAPYMKRPLYYGFDALKWNREEARAKRSRLQRAVDAFYGTATRSVYMAWKAACRIKQDSQAEAERVLKNFLLMWGESRKVDAFRGWHRAWIIRKNARELAFVRRRERAWWRWLEHWEEMVAMFQAVAVKCSKFLAMLTGQAQVEAFHSWKRRAVNKRKARVYASSKSQRMVESIFHIWQLFEKESRLERRLHAEARDKLKSLLKVLASDKVRDCFQGWNTLVRKKIASLKMWRETHLTKAWVSWYAILEEFYEIKRAVTGKCARLVMELSGDAARKCFFGWKELLGKKRLAVRRWTHASLIACWSRWAAAVEEAARVRELLASVQLTWGQRALRVGFFGWAEHADARLYNRQLVADAISMWTNVRVVHAFRSLDEHARAAIHYRTVVNNFRTRFRLRPAQISLLALGAFVRGKNHRAEVTRRVAFKYANKWAVFCFNRMREEVQDKKIENAMTNSRKSDILYRMKQRALFAAFPYWVEGKNRSKVLRHISSRIWARVRYRWLSEHFDRWANLFVDISFEDRHDALKKSAWAAIEGGGDLDSVLDVLASHPIWSHKAAHTRVAAHLEGFLLIKEEFDPEAHLRAERNKARREQLRLDKLQVGAKSRFDGGMKLKVGDVLRLQEALAPRIAGHSMYWRMIEGLSVILKKQNPHPPVPAEDEGDEEQSTLGSQAAPETDSSAVEGEPDMLRMYAETPAPSARDLQVLDGIGWHQIAKISLTNTKAPALQQILPSYLGGRWAGMGVKRLHEQVHELYPLKQTKRWADEEQSLQVEEAKRRFLRTRTRAIELLQRQRRKLRAAAAAVRGLRQAQADREAEWRAVQAEVSRLWGEAERLDDEDPFEHKKAIKTLRARAAAMRPEEAAAEERSLAASEAAAAAAEGVRGEERQLAGMVVRMAELLRGEEEARELMAWPEEEGQQQRSVRFEDGAPPAEASAGAEAPGEAERGRARLLERRAGGETGAGEEGGEEVDESVVEAALSAVGQRRSQQDQERGAEQVAWIEAAEGEGDTSSMGGRCSELGGSVWSEQISDLGAPGSPDSLRSSHASRVAPSGGAAVRAAAPGGKPPAPGSHGPERLSAAERYVGGSGGGDGGRGRARKFPRISPPASAAASRDAASAAPPRERLQGGGEQAGGGLPAMEAPGGAWKAEAGGRSTPTLPPISR